MVARGWWARSLYIDKPKSPGDPRRVTVKAHTTSTQPPSPLRNPESISIERSSWAARYKRSITGFFVIIHRPTTSSSLLSFTRTGCSRSRGCTCFTTAGRRCAFRQKGCECPRYQEACHGPNGNHRQQVGLPPQQPEQQSHRQGNGKA